jgi:hypothetical protein
MQGSSHRFELQMSGYFFSVPMIGIGAYILIASSNLESATNGLILVLIGTIGLLPIVNAIEMTGGQFVISGPIRNSRIDLEHIRSIRFYRWLNIVVVTLSFRSLPVLIQGTIRPDEEQTILACLTRLQMGTSNKD